VLLLLLSACQASNDSSAQQSLPKKEATHTASPLPSEDSSAPAPPTKPSIPPGWQDPTELISDAILDIRYATENNFVGEQLYPCPACWLRPAAAKALALVADSLRSQGYRIILFDCYRPVPIQERLWAIKPDATYVTPPARGSMHNRGLAVDIGLADLEGKPLDMGTPFDYFGRPAHHDFTSHPPEIMSRRRLLKKSMEDQGFGAIRTEWWHYSYRKGKGQLSREQWPCPQSEK